MGRLNKNKEYFSDVDKTGEKIKEEISSGLKILEKIDNRIITFFGSHRVNPDHRYYQHCKNLAKTLGSKGYAIISGGGPGIMHAANSGATEADVPSIGFTAELLDKEKITDPIFTDKQGFHFFLARRFVMSIKSEALIFYPGGYGTLDELFEFCMLVANGIVDKVPIVCVNRRYWQGLFDWLENNPQKEELFLDKKIDLGLIHIVDEIDEVLDLLKD